MRRVICFWAACLALAGGVFSQTPAPAAGPLYTNDFERAEPGRLPEELLVMDGAFTVATDGTNRWLELPGAPLDAFGVLFGPSASAGLCVQARAYGTSVGRRYPTLAVGLNGAGGFRLQVTPAKKRLELFKGDELLGFAPFTWQSGTWTVLKLQARQLGTAEWRLEGKAWKEGEPEPVAWTLSHVEKTAPPAGRPALWASPFSGTPIRFDDLRVTPAPGPAAPRPQQANE